MENLQLNIHFDLVEKLNGLGLAPEYTSGLMDLHRELVWLGFFEHDISDEILDELVREIKETQPRQTDSISNDLWYYQTSLEHNVLKLKKLRNTKKR